MQHSTTIRDVTYQRLAGGLNDLLLAFFDAGVSYGMGLPSSAPENEVLAALLETVRARWHAETAAARAMRGDPDATDATLAALPDWLRAIEPRP